MIGTVVATLLVSLGIWLLFFFIVSPGEPLDQAQTTVVVGFSLLLVVAARWIVRKGKRRE